MSALKQRKMGGTIWDHLELILRWRWAFIIIMGLMAVSSVTYALLAKEWYRSSAKVLPPPSNSFGLSSFLPGLNMGAMGALGGMSNETNLVMTVLESRYIQDKVIDKYDWKAVNDLNSRIDAYDRYKKKVKWEIDDMGNVAIFVEETSPDLAANTVNFIIDLLKEKYNEISVAQARGQREFIERRLNQSYEDIENVENELQEFQRETGVIALEEQMASSVQSIVEIHKELILAEVQYEVLASSLPSDASEVQVAKVRINAIKGKLEQMNSTTDREDQKFLISVNYAPEIGIRYLRLKREIEIQYAILQFLLPQYEQARIVEMQDKSNLYVLDRGVPAEKRSKPKRAFIVIAWMFISFFILFGIVSFLDWLSRLEEDDPERFLIVNNVLNGLKPKNFFSNKIDGSTE